MKIQVDYTEYEVGVHYLTLDSEFELSVDLGSDKPRLMEYNKDLSKGLANIAWMIKGEK